MMMWLRFQLLHAPHPRVFHWPFHRVELWARLQRCQPCRLRAKMEGKLKDIDLVFAESATCPCGAGLAYRIDAGTHDSWDCSDILTGRALPKENVNSVVHTDRLPFAFWKVKSERRTGGRYTTRPATA